MTVGYHINAEEGLISIEIDASPSPDEMIHAGRAILNEDRFSPDFPQLIDLRSWLADDVSEARFQPVISFLLHTYVPEVNASIAVVVEDGLDRVTTAAIYRVLAATGHAELFDSYEQAVKWLIRREFFGRPAPGQPNPAG